MKLSDLPWTDDLPDKEPPPRVGGWERNVTSRNIMLDIMMWHLTHRPLKPRWFVLSQVSDEEWNNNRYGAGKRLMMRRTYWAKTMHDVDPRFVFGVRNNKLYATWDGHGQVECKRSHIKVKGRKVDAKLPIEMSIEDLLTWKELRG